VANTDEKVMALVKDELRKDPDILTSTLYDKAKSAVPSVGKLSLRQFNARYPLQIKRRMAMSGEGAPAKPRSTKPAPTRRERKPAAPTGGNRDNVRQVLLRFAADLSAADDRSAIVRVLAGIDGYVDDVVKATS
jgi:hypothetical protein